MPGCFLTRTAGIFTLTIFLILAGCTGGHSVLGAGGCNGVCGTPTFQAAVASGGNFSSGAQAANYSISVTNTGTAATNGTVTVTDPPTGFTVISMVGMNWSCTVASVICTYNNSVGAGQSFPSITVTGKVTANNGTAVNIPLSVSGGGAAVVTVIPTVTVTVAAVALSVTKSHSGNLTQR